MKGIILAGGKGSRLFPLTTAVSKQLMPVYDKPLIYYPLSVLMLAGIRDILIISTPEDMDAFKALLGDGSKIGVRLQYEIQPEPGGLPQAFIIGSDFIGDDRVCLILGDNIFFGEGFEAVLKRCHELKRGGVVFGCWVSTPERYGIVTFDKKGDITDITEKPVNPRSNWAIPGLYFFDNDVVRIARDLKPSGRGELEIIEVIQEYLDRKELHLELLGRVFAWFDAGTHESLLEAGNFVETIEKRAGLKVGCVEEIAFRKGFITKKQLLAVAKGMKDNQYGQYLLQIARYSDD
jgi:glucose-1-phosphate thymidylyltransferase